MCEACNATDWLRPRLNAADELAFQQARLHGWEGCPYCRELAQEVEELKDELRVLDDYYRRDP